MHKINSSTHDNASKTRPFGIFDGICSTNRLSEYIRCRRIRFSPATDSARMAFDSQWLKVRVVAGFWINHVYFIWYGWRFCCAYIQFPYDGTHHIISGERRFKNISHITFFHICKYTRIRAKFSCITNVSWMLFFQTCPTPFICLCHTQKKISNKIDA